LKEIISQMEFIKMPKVGDIVGGLKKIKAIRPRVSRSSLIKSALILLILVIAFGVRFLPVRWGYYMSEFDPYYQYRQTKYIVENGLFGENGWIGWHDYLSWYPWGNEIRYHSYPGLPLTAAGFYTVLNALGVPLVPNPSLDPLLSDPVYIVCVIFPVIMGTLTCLVMYFLGKDLGGEAVGLFAALFLALDASYIGRTSLGFFDDETVGIFSMFVFVFVFLRSIDNKRPFKMALFYAVAAGLSLGYLSVSWGASKYPIVMTALFTLVLMVIRRYSFRLLLSYAITFLLTFAIAISIPYLGTGFLFLTENLPVYGVLFLLLLAEINRRVNTTTKKLVYLSALIGLAAAAFAFLLWKGYIRGLEAKFQYLLNPFAAPENPILESVAEHRRSAWGTFYYNFGIGAFFLPVGLFFAAIAATNLSIFMTIYGLTSIYFASTMIRLIIVVSPVMSLLLALAVVRIMKPFILFLREPARTPRRKKRFRGVIGKETAVGIVILMFILLNLTYVIGTDFIAGPLAQGPRVYTQAYTPTTIASASMSVIPSDAAREWVDALIWMRENLPPSPQRPGEPGTVVASWWDYGYWITAIANRSSLADNGTWNWTQIKQIGLMFMSNETEAIKILKKYDVTHVLVFTTFNGEGNLVMAGGDEGKWEWMAKIPGLDPEPFGNYTLGYDWVDINRDGQIESVEVMQNSKGQNTTLYKLMHYGRHMTVWQVSSIQLEYFEEAYFSRKHGSREPAPGTSVIPLVCVYKVNYPPE
jgi:dolichyl-diphosphooligosaccharide--protein glycosyltransferase